MNDLSYSPDGTAVVNRPVKPRRSGKTLLLLVVLCGLSILFAQFSDRTILQKHALETLNKQEADILEVTAISASLSTLLAMVPDDSTTPVADQIAGVCSILIYVLAIILFERLVLSLAGLTTFGIIFPAAFVCFFLHEFWGKRMAKRTGNRLIVLGLILYLLIPASTYVCTHIDKTFELEQKIDMVRSDADHLDTEKTKDEGWWESIKSAVTGAFSKLFDGLSSSLNILKRMMNIVAVMLLTDIFIPLVVFFIFKAVLMRIINVFLMD